MLAGQVTTGASTSLTVTSNVQDEVLPLPSVATKVLVVVPTGNTEPVARPVVCAMVTVPQLSSASLSYSNIAPHAPGSLSRLASVPVKLPMRPVRPALIAALPVRWPIRLGAPPPVMPQSMVGGVTSSTVTVALQVTVYWPSLTLSTTLVTPRP